jgi:DNA polymerase beta
MNTQIVKEFNELINNLLYNKPPNYSFKVNSFKKTIEIIKNLDFNITNVNQLKDIKGIGKGTLDRINEILNNGKLNENKNIKKIDDFKELQTITGIGPSKAKQLIEKKFTFNDVINNNPNVLEYLTHHQLIGVKYYNDILKPIPRNIIEDV